MEKNFSDKKFSINYDRYASIFFSMIYLILFMDTYENYISVEWEYTGLIYSKLSVWQYLYVYLSVFLVSYFLPTRLDRPSSPIIWLLTMIVFIPTLPITLMTGSRSASNYYSALSVFTLVLIVASYASNRTQSTEMKVLEPDKTFIYIIFFIFLFLASILYYQFSEILYFSSIEETYDQRALSSEVSGGVLDYIKSYFPYVFTPFILSIGFLYKRYYIFIPIGIMGYVFTYMTDASKISLIIPILIFIFFAVMRWFQGKVYYLTAGVSVLTLLSNYIFIYSSNLKIFADLILLRSIAIPAQTFAQYSDLFNARGYTWWSNVRFINYFVAPPAGFAADPNWPILGRIVGAEYYGAQSLMNANANLFSGEGVAAAGSFGVLLIGAAFTAWLIALDRASRNWDMRLVVLLAVPLGMGLTNTHLSTLLLSFGGGFWLLVFYYYKPNIT